MGKVLFDFVAGMRFANTDLVQSALLFLRVMVYVPQLSSHTTWRRLPNFIAQDLELTSNTATSLLS